MRAVCRERRFEHGKVVGMNTSQPSLARQLHRAEQAGRAGCSFRRKRKQPGFEDRDRTRPDATRRRAARSRMLVIGFVGDERLNIVVTVRFFQFAQALDGMFDRHRGGKRDQKRARGGKASDRTGRHQIDAKKTQRVERRNRRNQGKYRCCGREAARRRNPNPAAMGEIARGSRRARQARQCERSSPRRAPRHRPRRPIATRPRSAQSRHCAALG